MSSETKQKPQPKAEPKRNEVATPSQEGLLSAEPLHPAVAVQQARFAPHALTPHAVMQLQRTIGNRAVAQLLQRSMPPINVASVADAAGTLPAASQPAVREGLPPLLQAKMEQVLGADFSGVRIHPESQKAVELSAHAYTQGEEIHFAPGQYQPHSPQGQHLVGHELSHVVQQRKGRVPAMHTLAGGVAANLDPALEQEAERQGARAAEGARGQVGTVVRSVSHTTGAVVQGLFIYSAAAVLERQGGNAPTPMKAEVLQIDRVTLPFTKRPPTQFGKDQKAHSVSWTLLKRAYESVQNAEPKKSALGFITDYLQPDWEALAEQKPFLTKREAHQKFSRYLDKYNIGYFAQLKDAQLPPLQWHSTIQDTVTDYFVALQLAPLSTHAGYTQKKRGAKKGSGTAKLDMTGFDDADLAGIQESQPSGHGEPASNRFFRLLEASLKNGEDPPEASGVITHARNYWDSGLEMEHGIHAPAQVAMILKEFERAFARAYPKTWERFQANIHDEITLKDIEKAKTLYPELDEVTESKLEEKSEDEDEDVVDEDEEAENEDKVEEGEEEDLTGASAFQSQVAVSAGQQGGGSAEGIIIKELRMPDDRPPTKYKPIGQKSHTVSWTLILKMMRATARGKSIHEFLQELLAKWILLQGQDWKGMIESKLITSGDYPTGRKPRTDTLENTNQVNSARLQETHDRILPNISRLTIALAGEQMSDLQWAELLQQTVSEYMVVYQSAPLTTFKSTEKTPKGHSESSSNQALTTHDSGEEIEWTKKLKGLFKGATKSKLGTWIGKVLSDKEQVKSLVELIRKNKEVDTNELAKAKPIVIKELALRYLDVQWNAVQQGGTLSLEHAPVQLAKIMFEWEQALQKSYPRVWQKYGTEFQNYANNFPLSKGLINQAKEKAEKNEEEEEEPATTLEPWINLRRNMEAYQRGLIAARTGNITPDDKDQSAFSNAQREYVAGIWAARRGAPPDKPTEASTEAHQDYGKGLEAVRGGDSSPIGKLAVRVAKEDYLAGIQDAQQQAQISQWVARAAGFNDYRLGVQAAALQQGAPYFGGTRGLSDYQTGIVSARAGKPARIGGHGQGHHDYNQGVQKAHLGQIAQPGAETAGAQDYMMGVAAARAGRPQPVGGQAQGHIDYLAGVTAAENQQPAQPGGHGTGHGDYMWGVADGGNFAFGQPQMPLNRGYVRGWHNARNALLRQGRFDVYNTDHLNSRDPNPSPTKKTRN